MKSNVHTLIGDRVVSALKKAGLDFNAGYGELFGDIARQGSTFVGSEIPTRATLLYLSKLTRVAYMSLYDMYVRDLGCEDMEQVVANVGIANVLKVDMFFYSTRKGHVYFVVDAYPDTFLTVPYFCMSDNISHTTVPASLSIN